jgi:hypothetical protein
VSPYNGAPVTVRQQLLDGSFVVIFAGFVPATGRVIVGAVPSGHAVQVTVGAVLQPAAWPFTPAAGAAADFVEMAGFEELVFVRCEALAGGLTQVQAPPPLRAPRGVIAGVVRDGCAGPPASGGTMQLRLPVSAELPQGFLLGDTAIGGDGRFRFEGVDPGFGYVLVRRTADASVATPGVLAAAAETTIGTPAVGQQYEIDANAGAVCNVLPEPP